MKITYLTNPVDIVHNWPALEKGFKWLADRTNFNFDPEKTLQTICHISAQPDKNYIAVLNSPNGELLSFLIAFDATPIYEEERVFQIFALLHKPAQIRSTRKLLNNFELWAMSKGVHHYYLPIRKYGKSNLSLFSRLGFKRDSLILTKEM